MTMGSSLLFVLLLLCASNTILVAREFKPAIKPTFKPFTPAFKNSESTASERGKNVDDIKDGASNAADVIGSMSLKMFPSLGIMHLFVLSAILAYYC